MESMSWMSAQNPSSKTLRNDVLLFQIKPPPRRPFHSTRLVFFDSNCTIIFYSFVLLILVHRLILPFVDPLLTPLPPTHHHPPPKKIDGWLDTVDTDYFSINRSQRRLLLCCSFSPRNELLVARWNQPFSSLQQQSARQSSTNKCNWLKKTLKIDTKSKRRRQATQWSFGGWLRTKKKRRRRRKGEERHQ